MKNPFTYLYYTGLLVLIVGLTFTILFIVNISNILPTLLSQQGKIDYVEETKITPEIVLETKKPEVIVEKPKIEKKLTPTSQSTTPILEKKDSVVKLEEKSTDTILPQMDSTLQTPSEL